MILLRRLEYQNELIAALTACGREKDIPYFTGMEYGPPIPEPFEITYSNGITAIHFAGGWAALVGE